MDSLNVLESGRLNDLELRKEEMNLIKGGMCACDARFSMSSGTIEIGVCICDRNYA